MMDTFDQLLIPFNDAPAYGVTILRPVDVEPWFVAEDDPSEVPAMRHIAYDWKDLYININNNLYAIYERRSDDL